jgi:hypothetical protein
MLIARQAMDKLMLLLDAHRQEYRDHVFMLKVEKAVSGAALTTKHNRLYIELKPNLA